MLKRAEKKHRNERILKARLKQCDSRSFRNLTRCGCGRAERSRWQDPRVRSPLADLGWLGCICHRTHTPAHCKKGKSSPHSISECGLIPVFGSQPAGDVSHKPGGRLPLLSATPAVTPATRRLPSHPMYIGPNFWTSVQTFIDSAPMPGAVNVERVVFRW